ncbi:MAG: hypothetical protein AAGA57_08765, partial [Planctomycetota bacterium]
MLWCAVALVAGGLCQPLHAEPNVSRGDRPYRVGVFSENIPGLSADRLTRTIDTLDRAGVEVVRLSAKQLESDAGLDPNRIDALVLTSSPVFPGAAKDNLDRYLRAGGDMVLLGGRGFRDPVTREGGRWLNYDQLKPRLAKGRGLTPLSVFDPLAPQDWRRSASNREGASRVVAARFGRRDGLRLDLRGVDHFDTYAVRLEQSIPEGHNVLVLVARAGSGDTRQAAFELRTEAGARWIATVDLSTTWTPIVLRPTDFAYYRGGPPQARGRLDFDQSARLSFGLARDFADFEGEDHQLSFTVLGTAELDVATGQALGALDLYTELAPFQYEGAETAHSLDDSRLGLSRPLTFRGPITGTAAFAVPKAGASQRFDVLQTTGAKGQPVTAGAVVAHYDGPFAGSQWFVVGVETDGFYRQAEWETLLTRVVQRMASESWIDEARRDNPFSDADRMRSMIGVTHAGAKYHHTDRDVLNEGALQVQTLGARTLKLWMPRPHQMYLFNHDWPDE